MKKVFAWMLVIALFIGVMPVTNASAGTSYVELVKKSATLTILNSETVTTYGKTTIKVKALNGAKLKNVTYKSKKKSIADVSDKGRVVAKKKGNTSITVTVKYKRSGKIWTKKLQFNVKVVEKNLTASADTDTTAKPTAADVSGQTEKPTDKNTQKPTVKPTAANDSNVTVKPTEKTTLKPSEKPTATSGLDATVKPTEKSTQKPTAMPTDTSLPQPTIIIKDDYELGNGQNTSGYAVIKSDTYKINVKLKSDMMLDAASNYSDNGTNIRIYKDNNTTAQHYVISHVRDGWHKISKVSSGSEDKVLDVKDGKKGNGVNVRLWDYNGSDAQLWRFYPAGNGYYYIQNKLGCYLDVDGAGKVNDTNVQVWEKNFSDAQMWKLINVVYPTGIRLKEQSITFTRLYETKKLTPVIEPLNATQKDITWTSSDKKVATVTDGTVKVIDNGTAIITAKTINGKTASAKVTVKDGSIKIDTGYYCLNTKLDTGYSLDVTGNGTGDGTNIQIYKNNNTVSQKFKIQEIGNGWYRIVNAEYPVVKCLDVSGASDKSGTNVQLYEYNGSDAQKWRFYPDGNGGYMIINKLGCYLDVTSASAKNNTNVWVYEYNGSNAQKWKLTKTDLEYENIVTGLYCIKTKLPTNSNKSLLVDVAGNGKADGTNIQMHWDNGSFAQKFNIERVSGGWYVIKSPYSNKCLDVAGGSDKSGTNVQLYEYNNSDAQKWRFHKTGNHVFIKNKRECYLDVEAANADGGANVQAYKGNNTDAQKWELIPTSIIDLTGIRLNPGNVSLDGVGKSCSLSVSYEPSNATGANTEVTWRSSNESIATVSNGVVKACGNGTAIITAEAYNGKTATAMVNVGTKSGYDEKVRAFLSDSRWCDGASWPAQKGPNLTNYGASGCCAYAADFVKFVFDMYGFGNNKYYNPSEIRAGDVIKVTGSQHWFVVLYRNGNRLTTAEGNWAGKVVVSSSAYTVSGNTLYRNGSKFRTFACGYHFQ